MTENKKRVRISENGVDLNLLAHLQNQAASNNKSKYDTALQELGKLHTQLIGSNGEEQELANQLNTLQKKLQKLEKLEKAIDSKNNAGSDEGQAQKRIEENFIYSLFLEQKLKKMKKVMKNKETKITRLKEKVKLNQIYEPLQSNRKLPYSRIMETAQNLGRPNNLNSSIMQNMYSSNPPEDNYQNSNLSQQKQYVPSNYDNRGANYDLETPLMNIRHSQPIAPFWDFDNTPMGNGSPQTNEYTPEQVNIINEMLMKNLTEKIQAENPIMKKKYDDAQSQEKAISTLPLLQIQSVPSILRYRSQQGAINYDPNMNTTAIPPTLNLQLKGNTGWAVNMQPTTTDYPKKSFFQAPQTSSVNRSKVNSVTPLPPIYEREQSQKSESQKGLKEMETPPIKRVPTEQSQKSNPHPNPSQNAPSKPPTRSRLAKILRKIFFAVYFTIAFKKSATKLANTRRQKIVSLHAEKEVGIVDKFTKMVSKIFDAKFDEAIFEDHFDVLPSKITDSEFLLGLDLLIKGFMDLNDSLAKPDAKDIIIFLASTIIPGGVLVPDFLSLFVGNRIRVSEQMVIAHGTNSLMEGLMSIAVFLYAQIFLDRYVLIDYHDDKFIQIITQVIYHFLISFFAKVVPVIPQDEKTTKMYIKTIHNWNMNGTSVKNLAPNQGSNSVPGKERSFMYTGDDTPIAGIPFDISHERFLNNKKVIDRLQTRFMPTLRKTYDLLNQGVKAIKQSILKSKLDRVLKLKNVFPKDNFYKLAEEAIKAKSQKLGSN